LATQTACQSDIGNSVEALNIDEAQKLFEIAQLTSFFSHREVWWLGLSDLVSEGRWIWSNSYDVEVNTSMYSDIWTPDTDPGNSNDCVVMTVGNNSQLIWKDIPCLSEEYESNGESKPIQAVCQCKGDDCPRFEPTKATVATPPAPHGCPDGWLYSGPGFGCIIPLTEQKDLSSQEAEAACLDVGGYLVEPRSKNREQHLEDIAEILYNVGFAWSWWLGLSFRESESEDGEQWLWTSDDRVPDITYWGTGEVDCTNGCRCAILAKLGVSWAWHQVDCDDSDYRGKSIGAICQECQGKDCPTPTAPPAPATTRTTTTTTTTPMTTFAKPADCATSDAITDGACFFLSTTKVTWVEAEQACMAYGGHLASLADEDENIFFGSVANGTNVWLGGFSRRPNEWAWTDDSEWSYDEWKAGEPSHDGYVFFEAGTYKWKAASAPDLKSFVCRIP